MRSPFAYTPRRGPLQAASPGAAVAYLGALVAVAFLYSSPLVLLAAGAAAVLAGRPRRRRARAVRAALRMGLALALLIVVVNALVVEPRRDGAGPARRVAAAGPGRRHRRGDRRRRSCSACAPR